jgi:hypothetical protein
VTVEARSRGGEVAIWVKRSARFVGESGFAARWDAAENGHVLDLWGVLAWLHRARAREAFPGQTIDLYRINVFFMIAQLYRYTREVTKLP